MLNNVTDTHVLIEPHLDLSGGQKTVIQTNFEYSSSHDGKEKIKESKRSSTYRQMLSTMDQVLLVSSF